MSQELSFCGYRCPVGYTFMKSDQQAPSCFNPNMNVFVYAAIDSSYNGVYLCGYRCTAGSTLMKSVASSAAPDCYNPQTGVFVAAAK